MGLREAVVDHMLQELDTVRAALLLVPPYALVVRRTADNVRHTIAVHVVDVHRRAVRPEIRRHEGPWPGAPVCRRFIPPGLRDDVRPPIPIHVADSQPMPEPIHARLPLLADRM